MTRRPHAPLPAILGLALALALALTLGAPPATAQAVLGTVVTRDTVPVLGAVVALLDSTDAALTPTLTDEFGEFTLRAPRAGTWRLRVEHVGYKRVVTLPFELRAGETVERRLHITDATTRIAAIEVRDRGRCEARPAEGTIVATLWDEARKALVASTTGGGTPTLLDIDQDEIEYDESFTRARTATRTTKASRVAQSFNSAPPSSLRALGYVRVIDTTTVYFGPDARALLSGEFAATHCFSLAGDDPRSIRRIGVAFTPVGRPEGLIDVAGTLWLDRETYELDRVEFRYVPSPSPEHEDSTFGGRVHFARLPAGQVIVKRWELRMPIFAPVADKRVAPEGATSRMLVRAAPREEVAGLKLARGAARLPGEGPAALPQVVDGRGRSMGAPSCATDSLSALGEGWMTGVARDERGRPARGAVIRAAWQHGETLGARTAFRAEWAEVAADPQGRYAICGVPAARPLNVTARAGDAVRFRDRIVVPRTGGLERDLALAAREVAGAASASGVLTGRVTDENGRPVTDALVVLFAPRRRAMTDADGRFAFDGLRPDEYDFHTRRLGFVPLVARFAITPGDTIDISYQLDRSTQALGAVVVTATSTSMNLGGFELRRAAKVGSGQFIGPEELERREDSVIIPLLRAFSRVNIEESRITGDAMAYGRDASLTPADGAPTRCAMRLLVDGALLPPETPLSALPPVAEMAGIEIYTSAGAIPAQFSFSRAVRCGLIAVWLRDGSR